MAYEALYVNVPELGLVVIGRHAHRRMREEGISNELFEKVLKQQNPHDIPDGPSKIFRDMGSIRIVILYKRFFWSVETVFRIKPLASSLSCSGARHSLVHRRR